MRAGLAALPLIWAAIASPACAAAPERAAPQIDWISAKKVMQASDFRQRAKGGGAAADEAKKVRLPILLIDHAEVPVTASFKHQIHSYAANYALEGASLTVLGLASPLVLTGAAFDAWPSTPTRPRYKFETTRDSSDLSFERFGAFYTIRISCLKPADARCTAPGFMSKLADKLAVAGGAEL